jgi:type II secretory pathway pseudopilin PulG
MFLIQLTVMLALAGIAVRRWRHLFLELMLVFLMIGALMTAFLQQAPRFMQKARLLTVLAAPAFTGQMEVMEDHALTGDWPDVAANRELLLKVVYPGKTDEESFPTRDIQPGGYIQQGAVQVEVQNRPGHRLGAPAEWWSFRPAVAADDGPTVIWVCGSHPPPAGFHALGENRTTIPPEENFHICR